MPKVMIWIRKEDWERWKGIADKPEFISNALHGVSRVVAKGTLYPELIVPTTNIENAVAKVYDPILKEIDEGTPTPLAKRLQNGICKIDGTPLDKRGKCLQKGCKNA